ncbi:MAG: hypothetical protein OXC92_07990 [Flavobacteriaceae bacterium]|nr:hypothetical protein [Flavobacteriaceae bacterium]MCY4216904.1 hypothetical protein [Flavobacteriaceae bacterium]MCY4253569.1 hypothetical protein [Flavobacteriaceae bacterium]
MTNKDSKLDELIQRLIGNSVVNFIDEQQITHCPEPTELAPWYKKGKPEQRL